MLFVCVQTSPASRMRERGKGEAEEFTRSLKKQQDLVRHFEQQQKLYLFQFRFNQDFRTTICMEWKLTHFQYQKEKANKSKGAVTKLSHNLPDLISLLLQKLEHVTYKIPTRHGFASQDYFQNKTSFWRTQNKPIIIWADKWISNAVTAP